MFGRDISEWKAAGAAYTASEIFQQPGCWDKTVRLFKDKSAELSAFISDTVSRGAFHIVLTGAGTSEFVGNSACPALSQKYGFSVRSHGTTDIVAAPEKYLSARVPTLLVSFARSGNSPESVGAVEAANSVCSEIRHLFITCNRNGALAKMAENERGCCCIVLPEETDDKSFAMTSSFSCLYLSALCAFHLERLDYVEARLARVKKAVERIFDAYSFFDGLVSEYPYERIVFLGTAELKGIAQESALKTLELSAGRVEAMYDSPMGFRHGPKSVVNDSTLTVIYLSDDGNTRRYEMDLVREMAAERKANRILAVSNTEDEQLRALGIDVFCTQAGVKLEPAFLGLQYVVIAQLIALLKSRSLGIAADDPCPTGEVNRVVKGVTIYPRGR